jgi:hypothetical protein
VDATEPKLKSAKLSEDGLRVELQVEGLQRGHVHHLVSKGLKSAEGIGLLHTDAYYTLNYLP